jgi:hypothetical protein
MWNYILTAFTYIHDVDKVTLRFKKPICIEMTVLEIRDVFPS